MKRSSASLVFNIFLAIGILLLITAATVCYNIKKFNAAAIKTNGRVVDLVEKSGKKSTTYSPVIIYKDAEGTEHRYIPGFSSNPPAYDIGESVEIYYDPKNTGDAKVAGWTEYIGAWIVGGLGVIFSLIGIVYHVVKAFHHSANVRLKESGQLVQADFISIDVNSAISMNNAHPFFIRCRWKDPLTGKNNIFKSGFIWFDPTHLIDPQKKVDVYINRNNPKKYYVDLSQYGEL